MKKRFKDYSEALHNYVLTMFRINKSEEDDDVFGCIKINRNEPKLHFAVHCSDTMLHRSIVLIVNSTHSKLFIVNSFFTDCEPSYTNKAANTDAEHVKFPNQHTFYKRTAVLFARKHKLINRGGKKYRFIITLQYIFSQLNIDSENPLNQCS